MTGTMRILTPLLTRQQRAGDGSYLAWVLWLALRSYSSTCSVRMPITPALVSVGPAPSCSRDSVTGASRVDAQIFTCVTIGGGGARLVSLFLPCVSFPKTKHQHLLRNCLYAYDSLAIQGSAYPPANFSQSPPFTFCPTFGSGDELANLYGPEAILKSRTHLGSVDRVRRVIKRAMAGLPITIGVLGGSVSSCHGLDATSAHPFGNPIGPNCYPHRIFSWLNDVFPHPANELTNGACEFPHALYKFNWPG